MRRIKSLVIGLGLATALGACTSTPERIDELESARSLVSKVESSPRAGVAAENISTARKLLDTANRLVENDGDLDDIKFHAVTALKNAQIADEKIQAAQARDQVAQATEERQRVLTEAREQEAQQAQQRAQSLEEELRNLRAERTDRGLVLTLDDVLFDTDAATLKPGAYATIERVATVLKENSNHKVLIEGHTDSSGPDEYNRELSERRARAVQAALMQNGVAGEQITSVGKGEAFPVATNDTAAGRQENRRVELVFQQSNSQVASGGG